MPLKAPERYEIPYAVPLAIGNIFFKNYKKVFFIFHILCYRKKKLVNYESVPQSESENRAAGA